MTKIILTVLFSAFCILPFAMADDYIYSGNSLSGQYSSRNNTDGQYPSVQNYTFNPSSSGYIVQLGGPNLPGRSGSYSSVQPSRTSSVVIGPYSGNLTVNTYGNSSAKPISSITIQSQPNTTGSYINSFPSIPLQANTGYSVYSPNYSSLPNVSLGQMNDANSGGVRSFSLDSSGWRPISVSSAVNVSSVVIPKVEQPNTKTTSKTTSSVYTPSTNSSYVASSYPTQQTSIEKAQSMYNNIQSSINNASFVRDAERYGMTVEKSGGYGVNPMTDSPVAYMQVDITPYDPVINATVSALNQGHKGVAITGEGVSTVNPNFKSTVINHNNPSFISPNGPYNMYRSTEQLAGDLSAHNAKVAATINSPMATTQVNNINSNIQSHREVFNNSAASDRAKFNNN